MPIHDPLDEDAVRQVLARAIELEHQRGGSLIETQVREIARELSIPAEAIDQALAEYRDGVRNPVAVRTSRRVSRSRLIVGAVLGLGLVGLALATFVVPVLAS